MPTYASDTKVPIERSRAELERILTRYGHDAERAVVMFAAHGRHVRLPRGA